MICIYFCFQDKSLYPSLQWSTVNRTTIFEHIYIHNNTIHIGMLWTSFVAEKRHDRQIKYWKTFNILIINGSMARWSQWDLFFFIFWLLWTVMISFSEIKMVRNYFWIKYWHQYHYIYQPNTDLYKNFQSIYQTKQVHLFNVFSSATFCPKDRKPKQKRSTIKYWDGQLNYPDVNASK